MAVFLSHQTDGLAGNRFSLRTWRPLLSHLPASRNEKSSVIWTSAALCTLTRSLGKLAGCPLSLGSLKLHGGVRGSVFIRCVGFLGLFGLQIWVIGWNPLFPSVSSVASFWNHYPVDVGPSPFIFLFSYSPHLPHFTSFCLFVHLSGRFFRVLFYSSSIVIFVSSGR